MCTTTPARKTNGLNTFACSGDASYDYKDRVPDNTNIVPVYHRLNSESTFFSYMSDEYYGMMDPEDGLMELTDKTDIALGRILADNVSLANTLVNKVIDYSSKASYGNWRITLFWYPTMPTPR